MRSDKNLESFVRQCLFRDGDSITSFELRHAAPGSKGHKVEIFKPPSRPDPDALRPLVEEIQSRAQMDADGLGGTQRYVLSAFVDGNDKPVTRLPFRITGEGDSDPDESGEESPSMRGLLTQLMRHNESNHRTLVNSMATILVGMGRRLDSSDRLNERLMDERFKTFELIEQLRSGQHDRDMEMLDHQSKAERMDKVFEKVSVLFPILVNRMVGKKVLAADEPFAAQVRSLAESLSPEQFNVLMGTLGIEQQAALVTILRDVQDSDAKSKPTTKQLSDKS